MYLFYWIPLSTEVKLRRLPWLTLLLIVLNTVVFCVYKYDPKGWVLINAWSLQPLEPSLLTSITANFLHASWEHLIGNMLYLWLFGAPVEDRIGPVKTLLAFLLCGAFSLMCQAWFTLYGLHQHQAVAILGASGAVSGITGLFLVRFYYAKVRVGIPTLILLRGPRKGSDLQLPALAVVIMWSMVQLASAVIAVLQKQGGTAYISHLSGIGTGILVGYALGMHRGANLERLKTRAERFSRSSRWFEAQDGYARYLSFAPGDIQARMQLARAFMLTRQDTAAAREYTQCVQFAVKQGLESETRDTYLEMRKVLPLGGLPLSLQRRVAEALENAGYFFESAEAWERYGRLEQSSQRAVPALNHAAALAAGKLGDIPRAEDLYRTILSRFPETEAAERVRARLQSLAEAS